MESNPLMGQFMATAEATAAARPEVDLEMAREVFHEAATLLHNSLALDGLDDHDLQAVVAGLCSDLVAEDPGAAIRARAAESGVRQASTTRTRSRGRTWWRRQSCSSDV